MSSREELIARRLFRNMSDEQWQGIKRGHAVEISTKEQLLARIN